MPIVQADISFQLSGGVANANPDLALGGIISANAIVNASLHNLFDIVSGYEAAAGDSEYRCFYIKNNHGTLTMLAAKVYVKTESPSADSDELIGLGSSAIGGVEQTIADEDTAPAAVVFTQSNLEANALVIGDIPAGSWKAIWVRRDIAIAASAYNSDSSVIEVKFETAA